MDWNKDINTQNERIHLPLLEGHGVELYLKREDLIHPQVSGNKWRKLKYHMLDLLARKEVKGVLTKGGAFSNHILATASACQASGLRSSAFIRGERVNPLNPTLLKAQDLGMQFHFLAREAFRLSLEELALIHEMDGSWALIPEGGTDALGIRGCAEILTERDKTDFDAIAVSFGTGGTACGLVQSLGSNQELWIYPALKGIRVFETMEGLINSEMDTHKVKVVPSYHFGGYAKIDVELLSFIRDFERETGIPLDPVYTSKMIYGILKDVEEYRIERGSTILAIHTGGLQGRAGMEQRLGLDFSIQ